MSALELAARTGEGYPPAVRRQQRVYRALNAAIDRTERRLARHFQDFSERIASRTAFLALPFQLDEFDDAVEHTLASELMGLSQELELSIRLSLRPVIELGGETASQHPLLARMHISWEPDRPEVEEWLTRHSLELVKDLDATTKQRLAAVLRRGVHDGASMPEIARQVEDAARKMSRQRARLIAQSEVLKSYNAGSVFYYRASGVVNGMKFLDGQYGACPYCKQMNGKVIKLDDEFVSTIGERTLRAPFPPLHPGCRCTTAPLIEGVE